MKNDDKVELFNKVLDALDRLFDREAGASDLYVIISTAAPALEDDLLFSLFSETAEALKIVARSGLDEASAREETLKVSDRLRLAIAAQV